MENNLVLAKIDNAKKALTEARTIPEFVQIRNVGHTAIDLARRMRLGSVQTANEAYDVILRAERRLGAMLAGMEKAQGGQPYQNSTGNTMLPVETLTALGITKMQSSRWQAEAKVPDEIFENWLADAKAKDEVLSSKKLIQLGRQMGAEQGGEPEGTYEPQQECNVSRLDELISRNVRFGCIYADPPWKYGNQATRASTDNHYSTLTVDEICAEPVSQLAADNAHLHLWTTNAFLPDAFRVIEAWDFTYKSCFVWVKPQMGIGNYWRVSHEFLLLGIRGKAPFQNRGQMSWLEANRTKHSRKPRVVRERIELVSPGPYLEMYGRESIEGWTVYGNQIERNLFDGKV